MPVHPINVSLVIRDRIDNAVFIDTLFVAVPGPATGWLLLMGALLAPRSRRRNRLIATRPAAGRLESNHA